MNSKTIFETRQQLFKKRISEVDKKLDQVAMVRLLIFLVGLGLQIWSWSWGGAWWLLCLALSILVFAFAVKWNIGVRRKHQFFSLLLKINSEEIDRLDGKLSDLDEGMEFENPIHPYASDLDIFGKHSLYQLLNRATTGFGRQKLANWLLRQSSIAEIKSRQLATKNLAENIDWRQEFEAKGRMRDQGKFDLERLKHWLSIKPSFQGNKFNRIIPIAFPILLVASIVFEFLSGISIGISIFLLIGHFILIKTREKTIKKIHQESEKRKNALFIWAELLEHIEKLETNEPNLLQIKKKLEREGKKPSEELKELARILGSLELRNSGVPHFIMNILFAWDLYWVIRLEKWQLRIQGVIQDWFDVIAEMEALASLAALRFAFPEWSTPEIFEGQFHLNGKNIGHPLIPIAQRVNNPVDLHGNGKVWLITGSNMSGKSTYLRTIGLNAVLALAGGPVCADQLQLSPMEIVTSMRTIDSLEENTSSFYAELKRLKMVINKVKDNPNVLFLLDEILKGTNSKDRQAGARALVLQLHKYRGSGMVSTHDIELVDMAQELPLAIKNYSFNCKVSPDGKLSFDYKLTNGQCLSMNATALMRAMGIEV